VPRFEEDPRFQAGIDSLFNLGGRLTEFDFSGNLSPLAQTVELDPKITGLALEQAKAELGPAFEDSILRIKNEAAAANQLESSVFGDALSREAGRLNASLQGITAGAALEDRNRALSNRINLFGTGLNTVQSGTQFAGQNQAERNAFNLSNFENQLGLDLANRAEPKGGIAGALTGALGGAAAGSVFGPKGAAIGGIGGGLAGGLGNAGTGGQFLNAGASIFGNTRALPGSTASNDVFKKLAGQAGGLGNIGSILNFNPYILN